MSTLASPAPDGKERGHEGSYGNWSQHNHINIPMPIVVRVARTRPERERDAILWLANYARREHVSADMLTELLACDKASIRSFLSNPETDIKQMVAKVESLRSVTNANLRPPADTAFHTLIGKAGRFAIEKGSITEVIAKTRTGKTKSADHLHLQNLHRAIYFSCPAAESYYDFIYSLARACGVTCTGKQVSRIESQIRSCFGRGGFSVLIVDEAHYLWPTNLKRKPKRIEFLRSLWDENKRQVGILCLSTPQALLNANQATQQSVRWAPGQWEGRVTRFLNDADISMEDIEKVARWHCPEGDARVIRQLVLFAKISPGFFGAMTNALDLARFEAAEAKTPLTVEILRAAQAQTIRGTPLEAELKKKGVTL